MRIVDLVVDHNAKSSGSVGVAKEIVFLHVHKSKTKCQCEGIGRTDMLLTVFMFFSLHLAENRNSLSDFSLNLCVAH